MRHAMARKMYKEARHAKWRAQRAHLMMVYGGSVVPEWRRVPQEVKRISKEIGNAAYKKVIENFKEKNRHANHHKAGDDHA